MAQWNKLNLLHNITLCDSTKINHANELVKFPLNNFTSIETPKELTGVMGKDFLVVKKLRTFRKCP